MSRWQKVLDHVLSGRADANIWFSDLDGLLEHVGYGVRVRGSHHIYTVPGQPYVIDLQPLKDGKAKPYQVGQVRAILQQQGITQVP